MRGRRQTALAPGIYPDRLGYEARTPSVKGQTRSKRFPPHTPLEIMQAWQADERAYLLRCVTDDQAARGTVARGTLAGDVQHYLKRRTGRGGFKSDRSHLKAWTDAHGTLDRHKLTPHLCEVLIATWRAAGRAEKTIRHRVRVLRELWHALDGLRARTPVDGLKLPAVPRPHPVGIPPEVIRAVALSLAAGLTIQQRCGPTRTLTTVRRASTQIGLARFVVRALTGQRADQIMRTLPGDVDLDARIWWVRPAKGGHAVPFPLTDEMIAAWQLFIDAGAWGRWDWRSFAKLLRRHGWPKDIPPKNLRHSFAIDHLRAGTDLGDLQGLLGHSNIQTTRTFYAPVLLSRLQAVTSRRTLGLLRGATATVPQPDDE